MSNIYKSQVLFLICCNMILIHMLLFMFDHPYNRFNISLISSYLQINKLPNYVFQTKTLNGRIYCSTSSHFAITHVGKLLNLQIFWFKDLSAISILSVFYLFSVNVHHAHIYVIMQKVHGKGKSHCSHRIHQPYIHNCKNGCRGHSITERSKKRPDSPI